MFRKVKQKIVALFSRKFESSRMSKPSRPMNHSSRPCRNAYYPRTTEISPHEHASARERDEATLTPVPSKPNKFWLAGGPPSEKRKGKYEEKKKPKSQANERRTVSAENGSLSQELREEDIAVRDFGNEHDREREER